MKKILKCFICVLLLGVTVISGCGNKNNTVNYTTVEKLIVDYEYDADTLRRVEVDFRSQEKTVIDYIADKSFENTESLENSVELLEYIEESILADWTEGTQKNKEESSEEKVIWKIQVRTDGDDFSLCGFENDEYPDFWDGLIEMI